MGAGEVDAVDMGTVDMDAVDMGGVAVSASASSSCTTSVAGQRIAQRTACGVEMAPEHEAQHPRTLHGGTASLTPTVPRGGEACPGPRLAHSECGVHAVWADGAGAWLCRGQAGNRDIIPGPSFHRQLTDQAPSQRGGKPAPLTKPLQRRVKNHGREPARPPGSLSLQLPDSDSTDSTG
ncbi:hypothetical protein P7K49_020688 [Saguinus oedipus]|uniref:Uncharacterized protein n=1 Tax=Saguinus oedipus TaxID=9490 RepID=A0ABQ9V1A5_SAGOE|nr:hypothetical protein P7K49_020688 [Saguinus oedipus]